MPSTTTTAHGGQELRSTSEDRSNEAGPSLQRVRADAGGQQSSEAHASSMLSSYLLPMKNTTPSPLSGSQDLITMFGLKPLYDTYLRPHLTVPSALVSGNGGTPTYTGKEKERSMNDDKPVDDKLSPDAIVRPPPGGIQSIGFTIGGIRIGGGTITDISMNRSEGDLKKKSKMERNYTHLVQDIAGRNTIKKDNHLQRLVLNPDFQPSPKVVPLDEGTLREAFVLRPGQIPGFDTLIWENDGSPKKKRKKRKRDFPETLVNGHATGNGNASSVAPQHDTRKRKKQRGDKSINSPSVS